MNIVEFCLILTIFSAALVLVGNIRRKPALDRPRWKG